MYDEQAVGSIDMNITKHPHMKHIKEAHELIYQIEKRASPILREQLAVKVLGSTKLDSVPVSNVPLLRDIQGVVEHLREVLSRLNY